ncbi:hypothetical protein SDC9_164049 [bioreactor metagenome]|uniref:Uncharacterized protein n=1 Tax=bioreactor metagenome TaxID=1076179 RepID=A0A645FXT2_9ZZZZ
MPLLVDMAVIPALSFARPNTGNDNLLALAQQWFNHAFMGVIRFVGNHGLRVGARKPDICTFQIRCLPCCEMETSGVAKSVNGGMDLGAQTSSAATDGLALPPFCTRAVLMGTHDGCIDHGVLVIRQRTECFKHPQPHARAAPAHVAQVNDSKVAKALGQIAPSNTAAIAIQHSVNKETAIFGRSAHMPGPAKK